MDDMPEELEAGGAALWRSVTARFQLEEHEARTLREAARTVDIIDRLHTEAMSLPVVAEQYGGRVNPVIGELRQQRLAFARILAALRLPEDDDAAGDRPQRRVGVRGFHSLSGGGAA